MPSGAQRGAPDLSEFDESERESAGGQKLKLDLILEALDEERRAKLLAALRGNYKHGAIARVLGRWGHEITGASVENWRRKNQT